MPKAKIRTAVVKVQFLTVLLLMPELLTQEPKGAGTAETQNCAPGDRNSQGNAKFGGSRLRKIKIH